MFPHYSAEASKHLGLPGSPVIHLAVTTVANRLMPLAEGTALAPDLVRITALRCASGAALNNRPFACVAHDFRRELGISTDADRAAAAEAFRTERTDWLTAARDQLLAEGGDPGPDAHAMATNYGWNPAPLEGWRSNVEPPAVDPVVPDQEDPFAEWLSKDPLTDPGMEDWRQRREQGAKRWREALSGVPFYAKRAAEAEARTGDPLDYWKELHASAPNLYRN